MQGAVAAQAIVKHVQLVVLASIVIVEVVAAFVKVEVVLENYFYIVVEFYLYYGLLAIILIGEKNKFQYEVLYWGTSYNTHWASLQLVHTFHITR